MPKNKTLVWYGLGDTVYYIEEQRKYGMYYTNEN
jgi:hypothetical protein